MNEIKQAYDAACKACVAAESAHTATVEAQKGSLAIGAAIEKACSAAQTANSANNTGETALAWALALEAFKIANLALQFSTAAEKQANNAWISASESFTAAQAAYDAAVR